jgi:hypothetical protein
VNSKSAADDLEAALVLARETGATAYEHEILEHMERV